MLPRVLQDFIDSLSSLPGIGPKSATRLAFYLLNRPQIATDLKANLQDLTSKLAYCQNCGNIAEGELCAICTSASREISQLLVLESPLDVIVFEKTEFRGYVHVLGGLISPLQGIGPEQLNIGKLGSRIAEMTAKGDLEVIFALGGSLEAETTTAYLTSLLKELPNQGSLKITSLAQGIPSNALIEYQDPVTLQRSLVNRKGV